MLSLKNLDRVKKMRLAVKFMIKELPNSKKSSLSSGKDRRAGSNLATRQYTHNHTSTLLRPDLEKPLSFQFPYEFVLFSVIRGEKFSVGNSGFFVITFEPHWPQKSVLEDIKTD